MLSLFWLLLLLLLLLLRVLLRAGGGHDELALNWFDLQCGHVDCERQDVQHMSVRLRGACAVSTRGRGR